MTWLPKAVITLHIRWRALTRSPIARGAPIGISLPGTALKALPRGVPLTATST